MLRPLAIGLPISLLLCAGFVFALNFMPFTSPYFTWVIVGYIVLFPLSLIVTIVATTRGVKRAIGGGDAKLTESGRRATASVLAVSGGSMTVRVSGSPRYRMLKVRLKVEDPGAPAYETTVRKAITFWESPPRVGQRLTVYIDRLDRDNLYVDWADSAIIANAVQPGINVSSVSVGGQPVDLSKLSPQMAQLVQMGLNMAERLKPMTDAFNGNGQPTVINVTPQQVAQAVGQQPPGQAQPQFVTASAPAMPPAGSQPVQDFVPDGIEGRVRIENFRPYPDGTYDLDLYVTPRTKASYRLAMRTTVPQAQMDRLAKGLTLQARIDPEIPSRVELLWG